jgi:hypothetical protein
MSSGATIHPPAHEASVEAPTALGPPACLPDQVEHRPRLVPERGTPESQPPPRSRPYVAKPGALRALLKKRMKGFEPSTFAMARRRSSQLSYIRAVRPFYPATGGGVQAGASSSLAHPVGPSPAALASELSVNALAPTQVAARAPDRPPSDPSGSRAPRRGGTAAKRACARRPPAPWPPRCAHPAAVPSA